MAVNPKSTNQNSVSDSISHIKKAITKRITTTIISNMSLTLLFLQKSNMRFGITLYYTTFFIILQNRSLEPLLLLLILLLVLDFLSFVLLYHMVLILLPHNPNSSKLYAMFGLSLEQ